MSESEREARRARLEALRAMGIDPFPARVEPVERVADVRAGAEERDAAIARAPAPP